MGIFFLGDINWLLMILNSSTHIIDDLSTPSSIDNLFGLMDMKVDPARSPGYKIGHDNAGDPIPPPQKRQCLTYTTCLPVLGYLYLPNVEKVSLGLPDRVPQTHQPTGPGTQHLPIPRVTVVSPPPTCICYMYMCLLLHIPLPRILSSQSGE